MLYIYTHQGLGDHIICNGLIRHFAEINEKVTVFCKPHNLSNVKWMFRDNPKINVISLGEDQETINYIHLNNLYEKTLFVGHKRLWDEFLPPICESFDHAFYQMCGLPYEYRFSKFYIERDLLKEKEVYDYVNPNNEPYIFIHGDIDRSKIRSDLRIIENPSQFNIFEIISILQNAEELHLMESSIRCIVNSIELSKPKIFYHQYVRGYDDYHQNRSINNFQMIN